MLTSNVIHRVFRIAGDQVGTAFAIDVDDRQYMVTARHLVRSLSGACSISLFQGRAWAPFAVTVVGHADGETDVSVLAPSRRLTPATPLPLPASSNGLIYGQDVYFLGFPYNILTRFVFGKDGYPMPLVKRATVSALDQDAFLLDGHNNPGFSRGPVVFSQPNAAAELRVAAIISGFEAVEQPVFQGEEETAFTYRYNTGIIVAHDIRWATDIIAKNPVGLPL